MRNIKFLLAMSLLVFIFSGCGGSSSGGDDESESTLHTTVSELLTGQWVPTSATYSGTATTASDLAPAVDTAATEIYFRNFKNVKIAFSGIEFASSSNKSAGNAEIYYSFPCTAYNSSGVSLGDLTISSVSTSKKTASMVITRGASDNEWIFTGNDGTKITASFSSLADGEDMQLTITGTSSSSIIGDFSYEIESTFTKTSTSTEINDDNADSTLHTELIEFLTGRWIFDESSGFVGKATSTVNGTATTITFGHVTDLKLIFSDIAFASNSDESAGTGNVYYSYVSGASDESENSLGNFTLKSYASGATTKTQNMVLTRVSDTQWIFQTSSISIIINLSSFSSGKIDVQLTGTGYLSALGSTCDYTIQCSMVKTTASTDIDDETSEEEGTDTSGIADILTGTWKLITEDSATATSTTEGVAKTLNLRLASSVDIVISSVDLSPQENTTSQTGTAYVKYSQTWRAFYDVDDTQAAGTFTFSKDEKMKLAKISDTEWRIEDIDNAGTNEDENIKITITSNTEIATEWHGITSTLDDGDSYYYEITSSFRKQ